MIFPVHMTIYICMYMYNPKLPAV